MVSSRKIREDGAQRQLRQTLQDDVARFSTTQVGGCSTLESSHFEDTRDPYVNTCSHFTVPNEGVRRIANTLPCSVTVFIFVRKERDSTGV